MVGHESLKPGKNKTAIKEGTSLCQSPRVMKQNLFLTILESGEFSVDMQAFVQGLLAVYHTRS